MNKIERLNAQFLDTQWPYVAEYLGDGLLSCEGEIDLSQLRMMCANGLADIFVVFSNGDIIGALAVETIQYPNFRAANIISAGGKGMYNRDFWPLFKDWLKALGYSKVQGYCRPGVARLLKRIPEFRTAYELIRADL